MTGLEVVGGVGVGPVHHDFLLLGVAQGVEIHHVAVVLVYGKRYPFVDPDAPAARSSNVKDGESLCLCCCVCVCVCKCGE